MKTKKKKKKRQVEEEEEVEDQSGAVSDPSADQPEAMSSPCESDVKKKKKKKKMMKADKDEETTGNSTPDTESQDVPAKKKSEKLSGSDTICVLT